MAKLNQDLLLNIPKPAIILGLVIVVGINVVLWAIMPKSSKPKAQQQTQVQAQTIANQPKDEPDGGKTSEVKDPTWPFSVTFGKQYLDDLGVKDEISCISGLYKFLDAQGYDCHDLEIGIPKAAEDVSGTLTVYVSVPSAGQTVVCTGEKTKSFFAGWLDPTKAKQLGVATEPLTNTPATIVVNDTDNLNKVLPADCTGGLLDAWTSYLKTEDAQSDPAVAVVLTNTVVISKDKTTVSFKLNHTKAAQANYATTTSYSVLYSAATKSFDITKDGE